MRTALIDGDVIVYESSSAAERRMIFGDQSVVHADIGHAIGNVDARIRTVLDHTNAQDVIVCLSSPDRRYWRHDLYEQYKSNRKGTVRPTLLGDVRKHIEQSYRTAVKPGLEADDVLGILATHPDIVPGERIVVTTDKDMKQIPGLHLNPAKLSLGVREVGLEAADRWHMFQTLTGDSVDGYPGCPGIGPVRADAILSNLAPGAMWSAVVATFLRKGRTADDALTQARVSRILRAGDWDSEKQVPILWSPPTDGASTNDG